MSALGGAGGQFDILSWAINGLQMVLNAVGPVVIMVIQAIIQHFRNIYTAAQIAWPYVASAISTAIGIATGVINAGRAVFNGLVSTWHTVSSTVQSMASAISGALSAAGSAWESFKSTVMAAVQPIIDAANQVGDAIGGIAGAIGLGGIETPMVSGAGGYGNGSTMVSQGNTIIFNMYGDIRDEKTLDDTIDAINNRINFEALANGVNTDSNGGAI
jgi:phage-related protein